MENKNIPYTWNHFPNIGYLRADLTDEQLAPIRDEIQKIISTDSGIPANHNLAGHIAKEYLLVDCFSHVEELVLPLIESYIREFGYVTSRLNYTNDTFSRYREYNLETLWANIQSKHEFNPLHTHSGLISFTIWIDIPYSREYEDKVYSPLDIESQSGNFGFVYTDCLGQIRTHSINTEKKHNNTILIFPSEMSHFVHPFYTSDNYRITVAGNFNMYGDLKDGK